MAVLFEKTKLLTDKQFHYCPGCNHGIIHRLVAEVIDEMNLDGKVIGVDTDQSAVIDGGYGEGMTVTSAMKGLAPTVKTMLSEVVAGNFANYGGKIDTLGLVSDNPEDNYVQLPMGSTQFADGKFTVDDYKALVADMFAGKTTVSNDTTKAASDFATVITVDDQGAIK